MRLYIDIETIPSDTPPTRAELLKALPGTIKKQETIDKWLEENDHLVWQKESLNSMKGNICSIAWAFDAEDIQVSTGPEEVVLDSLFTSIKNKIGKNTPSIIDWVGHNILGFDLPFIFHRSLIVCPQFTNLIQKDKRNVYDTMKLWNPWDYRNFTGLKDIANFLGLEVREETGAAIWDLWNTEEFDTIKEYNKHDVHLTREIFKMIQD